jgi:hypothetical protein
MNENVMTKYVLTLCAVLYLPACILAVTVQEAMDCEVTSNVWVTEADLSEFTLSELRCEIVESGSYNLLRNGISRNPAASYIKQGQYSLKWTRHNQFPTLTTDYVETDWSSYSSVSFWIYSEVPTGEKIYFMVESDSTSTDWKDFYYTDITIDWSGWQQVSVDLVDFDDYETPDGWDNVSKIGFMTKFFGIQPNPYTVLYIDDINCQ